MTVSLQPVCTFYLSTNAAFQEIKNSKEIQRLIASNERHFFWSHVQLNDEIEVTFQ